MSAPTPSGTGLCNPGVVPPHLAESVPPITPEMLVRIYGAEQACPECVVGGRTCAICTRQAPEGYGWRAAIVVTFFAWGALAIVAGLVWAMFNG